jgi:hypothetical protein
MTDPLDDRDLPFDPEMAGLFGELDRQLNGPLMPGDLLAAEAESAAIPPELAPPTGTPTVPGYGIWDFAELAAIFEPWQEQQIVPPPPEGPPVPSAPPAEVYGSIKSEPPLPPETGPLGSMGWLPPGSTPLRIGRSAGVRRAAPAPGQPQMESKEGVWCARERRMIAEPDGECMSCEETCRHAGGGPEEELERADE